MKITENEMRGLLAGKCLPGDMKVNEELPAYLVRKFFALQQKLDALAAENAALKEYLKECSVVQGEGNWTSDTEKSVYVPAEEWMPRTPATDAILNAVRAEGAELCVKALVSSEDEDFTDAPNVCAMVAYQLRAGKEGER